MFGGFEAFLCRKEKRAYLEQDEFSFFVDGKLDVERIMIAECLQFREKLDQFALPSFFGRISSFCLVEGVQVVGGTFRDRPGISPIICLFF